MVARFEESWEYEVSVTVCLTCISSMYVIIMTIFYVLDYLLNND